MSRYASTSDLYALGIPQGAIAAISAASQELALDAACDLVDSYLSSRYVLPLTTFGNDIRRAVCQIAAFDLLCSRGFNPEDQAQAIFKTRADRVEEWLKRIAKEEASPTGIVDSSPQAGTPDAGMPWTGQAQTVTTSLPVLTLGGEPTEQLDDDAFLQVGPPRLRGF